MERALTTKSMNFREVSQWTAATTLVAAGTLALFSATTIDKLSRNGEVRVDLRSFRKLTSASIAVDRLDEQKIILEEGRLLERVAFASAETLPQTNTGFKKIRLRHFPTEMPVNTVISLSSAEVEEIALLERARDPAFESAAIAQMYRNLRFNFIVAAELPAERLNDWESNSVKIAETTESFEYDELPEFKGADFIFSDFDSSVIATGEVETAPARALDSITTSASAPNPMSKMSLDGVPTGLTAEPLVLNGGPLPPPNPAAEVIIASPNLDQIPDSSSEIVTTQEGPPVTNHTTHLQMNTGPPDLVEMPKNDDSRDAVVEVGKTASSSPDAEQIKITDSNSSPIRTKVDESKDLSEYSKDLAAIYGFDENGEDVSTGFDPDTGEYSSNNQISSQNSLSDDGSGESERELGSNASIIVGDFQSSPAIKGVKKIPHPFDGATITDAGPRRNSSITNRPSLAKDYGNGVVRDDRGTNVHWNAPAKRRPAITVARPEDRVIRYTGGSDAETKKSLDKFTFETTSALSLSQSQSLPTPKNSILPEPIVDPKKCESAQTGVEALNAGAEKETLTICRRILSAEGEVSGNQSRWWESYENASEHWPTISFQKPEPTTDDRVPLLSAASIRILSAISKTNTHTGTGIIFGEVEKDYDIKLLGRSDAPIFLDKGIKLRDPAADVTGTRQFVFLNVEPGQPLLSVKNEAKKISGAIPLVVKSGMATYLKVRDAKEVDLPVKVLDASALRAAGIGNLTVEVIGQPGKMGITDRTGNVTLKKVTVFGEYPIYLDVVKNEKSYKNRYRISPVRNLKLAAPLYFFDEKRVGQWLSQLTGGLSPYSGLIAGVAPAGIIPVVKTESRHFKIGVLEKKSSLTPERYLLDPSDRLVSDSPLKAGLTRYIGVQVPEGPVVPTIVNQSGEVIWSELTYAQPGVINVINPE